MIKLAELLQMNNMPDLDITGLSSDSRSVRRGFAFFALPGSNHDGCEFIDDAVNHGAAVIVLAKGAAKPKTLKQLTVQWVEVENPRLVLAQAASRFYKEQPETIVAVTGTNGKTSTVHFVRQIWEQLSFNAASLGTIGLRGLRTEAAANMVGLAGSITTLDPVRLHVVLNQLSDSGIDHLAMEASSHGLDQFRMDGVKISAAGFTNITHDHLDYHQTMENYAAAKWRLFTDILAPNGVAVINADAEYAGQLLLDLQKRGIKVFSYGFKGEDLKIFSQTPSASGQNLELEIFGQKITLNLPLVGLFQVMNLLCAAGLVLARCQKRLQEVIDILPKIQTVPGRLEFVSGHSRDAAIYVDYAHTPDALEHVLKSLRPHTKGKLICVFGCGGNRDKAKRPVMGKIASELADITIVTDDNPRNENAAGIRSGIIMAAPNAIEIGNRAAAIAEAIRLGEAGDIIVIAGKGHEQGQIIEDTIAPFDDVTEALSAIKSDHQKFGVAS